MRSCTPQMLRFRFVIASGRCMPFPPRWPDGAIEMGMMTAEGNAACRKPDIGLLFSNPLRPVGGCIDPWREDDPAGWKPTGFGGRKPAAPLLLARFAGASSKGARPRGICWCCGAAVPGR